ncbi:MAG TPA: helix-turn-helix domain-containing protein [Thermoanaerobaculales bacterium]|nr:helix-turn-helix domain-containing protein [Thermoanaerobaculales bacterium]
MESPTRTLTPQEAADYLRCSPETLAAWRVRGRSGPPFIRLSHRKVLYLQRDLDAFLESRRLSGDAA